MALTLTSPEFSSGSRIPKRYSSEGAGVSPPLSWSGVPRETQEFALLCEDPDAPLPHPFTHWIAYGISPSTSQLPEGIPNEQELELPILIRQGLNTLLKPGYTPPSPPPWHGPHRYIFRLFALRLPLPLRPGVGREEFLKAIEGRIIEETRLTGTYERIAAPKNRETLRKTAAWGRKLMLGALFVVPLAAFLRSRRISSAQDRKVA